MIASRLALPLLAALVLAACGSKETRPEPAAGVTASTSSTTPPPATAPTPPAKPNCPPAGKATGKKGSKGKTAAPQTPAECSTAPSETSAKVVSASPGAAANDGGSAGKACSPCTVKSRDGSFDGEIHGTIPANSKWARLKIGMHQSEVERIIGTSHYVRAYVTGKAFIPFYFGSDRHRYEVVYPGQGSVAYTGGSFGGGTGVLMMINFDARIQ